MYKKLFARVASFICMMAFLVASLPSTPAYAAQLTDRALTLSNSDGGGTSVTYTFTFTPAASTTIKSVNIDICDSASDTCSPSGTGVPSGFTSTSASVGTISGIGSGGTWTGTFTTNGRLRVANNSNTGSPTNVSIGFTGITNPTADNTTFWARVTTYSDNSWSTAIDSGTVAASTAAQITVSASVDETLTFCTGTSGITSSSCASATGTSVSLGTLTTSSTGTGTSQIGVSTNADSGYSITVNGTTLTSGSNTLTALSAQTASSQGSSQFGINLKDNATPNIGSDPAGSGSATPTADYGTADQFKFVTADDVASAASADDFRLFTVSYIANISGSTPPGTYTTTLTYIATATF